MFYFYLKGIIYGKSIANGGFLGKLSDGVSGFETFEDAQIFKRECLSRIVKKTPGVYDRSEQLSLLETSSIIEENDLRFINAHNSDWSRN